jgi:hypothetical protein
MNRNRARPFYTGFRTPPIRCARDAPLPPLVEPARVYPPLSPVMRGVPSAASHRSAILSRCCPLVACLRSLMGQGCPSTLLLCLPDLIDSMLNPVDAAGSVQPGRRRTVERSRSESYVSVVGVVRRRFPSARGAVMTDFQNIKVQVIPPPDQIGNPRRPPGPQPRHPARRPGHHLPEHHRAGRPRAARLPARHYPYRPPAAGPRAARRQPPPWGRVVSTPPGTSRNPR